MNDVLLEVGTEELPPKALAQLAKAFCDGLVSGLTTAGLQSATGDGLNITPFATPRRLAIILHKVPARAPDKASEKLGPNVKAAFDKEGNPSKAALGFASSCGVDFESLERIDTDKGERLVHRSTVRGKAIEELLQAVLLDVLSKLPIPKRMRWGARRDEFIRPVKWLLALHGNDVLNIEAYGVRSGRTTRGHRFAGIAAKQPNSEITIDSADQYEARLESDGKVIADYEKRKQKIQQQLEVCGQQLKGVVANDEALLDEVCSLVEWPCCLFGKFDEEFLQLPEEALISSMRSHQKYFHVFDSNDRLMPYFITVANIDSLDPAQVIAGNERVIRPRLADSQFFYAADTKRSLTAMAEQLDKIVFQDKLGSVGDKVRRIETLALFIGEQLPGTDHKSHAADCARAAQLCKADLVSDMVGEFADLQGTIGRYYAKASGESATVAQAIEEHYLPRFAGDQLPETAEGMWLSLADRLDTLVGIFGIGQPPTGSKDPFALRRASLGLLRILIEKQLDLPLRPLIQKAIALHQSANSSVTEPELEDKVLDYILERMRSWYGDRNIRTEIVNAVLHSQLDTPTDIDRRIQAVSAFAAMEQSSALAAANKRVGNLLAKQDGEVGSTVDQALLTEPSEQQLAAELARLGAEVSPLVDNFQYEQALQKLAGLKAPVDQFFDQVMVMDEDLKVRANRLALLKQLKDLFAQIADISALAS